MSGYQFQVNSPCFTDGVELLPGTYSGQIHRRTDVSFGLTGEPVTYSLYMGPAVSHEPAVSGNVKIVDVTKLVETGAVTIIS
jgi:hypothetical protein